MSLLVLRNRQKTRLINLRLLRSLILFILRQLAQREQFELGVHLVTAREMAKINESFLQHEGSTDVITFDYREENESGLHGEIFICIDDAVTQAREFHTTWQTELARYVAHGILHLEGYDDLRASTRKKMKRMENLWVEKAAREFPLNKLKRTR